MLLLVLFLELPRIKQALGHSAARLVSATCQPSHRELQAQLQQVDQITIVVADLKAQQHTSFKLSYNNCPNDMGSDKKMGLPFEDGTERHSITMPRFIL